MFGLKMSELVIILVVVLILFGGTKLPQLGSSLGQAIRNFKRGFGAEAESTGGDAARPDTLAAGAPDANKARSAAASKDA
jgi:sec-independent protein translocase protein TatA